MNRDDYFNALMGSFGDPTIPNDFKAWSNITHPDIDQQIDELYDRYDPRIVVCILDDSTDQKGADGVESLNSYGGMKVILSPRKFGFKPRNTGEFEENVIRKNIYYFTLNMGMNSTKTSPGKIKCLDDCMNRHAEAYEGKLGSACLKALPVTQETVTVFYYEDSQGQIDPSGILAFIDYISVAVEIPFARVATRPFPQQIGADTVNVKSEHYEISSNSPVFAGSTLEPLVDEFVRVAVSRERQIVDNILANVTSQASFESEKKVAGNRSPYATNQTATDRFDEALWSAQCRLAETGGFDVLKGLALFEKVHLSESLSQKYCDTVGLHHAIDISDALNTDDNLNFGITILTIAESSDELKKELLQLEKIGLKEVNVLTKISEITGKRYLEDKIAAVQGKIDALNSSSKFDALKAISVVAGAFGGVGQLYGAVQAGSDLLKNIPTDSFGGAFDFIKNNKDKFSDVGKGFSEGEGKVDAAINYLNSLDPSQHSAEVSDLQAQLADLKGTLQSFLNDIKKDKDLVINELERVLSTLSNLGAQKKGFQLQAQTILSNAVVKELFGTVRASASPDDAKRCLQTIDEFRQDPSNDVYSLIVNECQKHVGQVLKFRDCVENAPEGDAATILNLGSVSLLVNSRNFLPDCNAF